MQGTLKIRDVKKGKEYKVAYTNAKGKDVEMAIHPENRCFDLGKVADGDPVEFELVNGQPGKCVVPGKEAAAIVKERPKAPPQENRDSYSGGYGGSMAPRSTSARALCNAVAPYNFVPFEADSVLPAFEDEEGVWSGRLVCRLVAKKPLLVCGSQTKATEEAPASCKFMEIDGKKVVAGTTIKGMLRSLIQILSFSNMLPVSQRRLFWRRVDRPDYTALFEKEKVLGGYLRKVGADYTLAPVTVETGKPGASPVANCELVKTGGMKNFKTGVQSCDYYFHKPGPNVAPIRLKREVVDNFWAQLTPNQESSKRWDKDKRRKRMETAPGLPVFYRLDETGEVANLGFCRYFRLPYTYTPFDLAYPDGVKICPDFATRLFGTADRENTFKGRVSVESSVMDGKLYRENGIDVVLGGPKPTCLPVYVRQNPASVKTMSNGRKNNLDSMQSYNDRAAQIRGHKLYWHHDVDEQYFPGKETMTSAKGPNFKVITRLFPLAEGAASRIVIHVDHLTDSELGCLLEAIELPAGHAHKLGMGKSLGFGSVRLEIEKAEIADSRQVHGSLARRLAGEVDFISPERLGELRKHFRQRIVNALHKKGKWRDVAAYDELPPIRALRIMMDYERRPKAETVRTMTLRRINGDPLTDVNYGNNAILPPPEEVAGR